MANSKHLAKLKEGVEPWNQWRRANPRTAPNLSMANLYRAHLVGADLRQAKLSLAYLSESDLAGADLTGASLGLANLSGADLSGANLTGTYLQKADFSKARLRNTVFSNAALVHTIFANNDLSRVIGLDAVVHLGPSTIGIDTVYRSHGRIPLAFLRGAGVPDNFIEYMGSLTGKALEFYSCFISYSTKDQEFADRL